MLWRKCPSIVWLEPLDRCDVVVGQPVELNSALLNPSASARLSVTDRELRMSAFSVREPELEQRAGQVVKSGAEIVSKFAYNDTQSERRLGDVAVFEAVATGITMWLHDSQVRLALDIEPDIVIQRLQVLVRPLNLRVAAAERILIH